MSGIESRAIVTAIIPPRLLIFTRSSPVSPTSRSIPPMAMDMPAAGWMARVEAMTKCRAVVDEPVREERRHAQEEHVPEQGPLELVHLLLERGHLLRGEVEKDLAADRVGHQPGADAAAHLAADADEVGQHGVPRVRLGPLVVEGAGQDRQHHGRARAEGPEDLEDHVDAPDAGSGMSPVVLLVLPQAAPQVQDGLLGLAHQLATHHVHRRHDLGAEGLRQGWGRVDEGRDPRNGQDHGQYIGHQALPECEAHGGSSARGAPPAHPSPLQHHAGGTPAQKVIP
mmetsp:Transcript_59844/g.157338  ORF Transcript_59844/g.157338 Transcript_59844/m.157338 type:complete len:283 (+) Transcript_59844:254-1102(+)